MNNTKNTHLGCDIVRDLLPLYYDNVVSDTTAAAVAEHISGCNECSKEYDSLFSGLPDKQPISTKGSFIKMMNKKKRKQIMTTVFTSIFSCIILVAGFFILTEVPLIEVKDVEVHKVFRYDAEDEDKFFLIYSNVFTSGERMSTQVTEENGETVYTHTLKRPVIAKSEKEKQISFNAFSATNLSDTKRDKAIKADCDKLVFCGNTVWTKEDNNDNEIPPYVYAYEEYEQGNQDEFGDSDSISWFWSIDLDNLNSASSYVGIQYPDFRTVEWSLNGDVIFDSAAKEKQ